MKITGFNPLILTPKADAAVELFEALGFERRHLKTGINDGNISNVSMKDANGFHLDIAKVEMMPQDMTVIRMMVDDFDEAYQFLTARGFKNAQGEKVTDTGSSRATLMLAPSGYAISLAQHIKK